MRLRTLSLAMMGWMGSCGPSRTCEQVVDYIGAAETVSLVGAFNDWDDEATPLSEVEPGIWRVRVSLPAGDHPYLLSVDGEPQIDPLTPLLYADPDTGRERSMLRVADCDQPAVAVERAELSPEGALDLQARFVRGRGGPPLSRATATLRNGSTLPTRFSSATGKIMVSTSGLEPGKHTVTVTASDGVSGDLNVRVPLWVEAEPFDWDGALLYQVVLDRFADGTGGPLAPDGWASDAIGRRFGGKLAGVTAALRSGWFESLSVDALWLSPVLDNPEGLWAGRDDGQFYEGYHGYWSISNDEIESHLGTEADLAELIDEAHKRGVRVLLDVVPNHVHQDHPWYLANRTWFQRDEDCICGTDSCPWSTDIQRCWFTPYLPDLDWSRPDVAPAMVGDIVDFAARFDVDGLRVDAVPMMPRAAVRELVWGARQVFQRGPTAFHMVGETFTGGERGPIRVNLGPHGLSGQFDFPVMWALRRYAAWGSLSGPETASLLADIQDTWAGSGAVMSPFIGNHDVSRFVSEAHGDDVTDPWGNPPPQPESATPYERAAVAQAVALSLPGMPVLFYGDEVGLAGANDPDDRRPMPFELGLAPAQAELLTTTRRLARARRCSRALRQGTLTFPPTTGAALAVQRVVDEHEAVLLVSVGDEPVSVVNPADATFIDALTGEPWTDAGQVTLESGAIRLLLTELACAQEASQMN